MRLITFNHGAHTRLGVLNGDRITDLSRAAPDLPTEMNALLHAGDGAMQAARAAAGDDFALHEVELLSPVSQPGKILAVALNYRDHLEEVQEAMPDFPTPETPILFTKQNSSVTGPFSPIYLPPESEQLDYEAELAIVIGKTCRRVPKERAHEVIAGAMTMGKSWDSHCPMGPALVTPDELDFENLDFTCSVNGEKRQGSNTNLLVFDIPTLINHLSTVCTLYPGDIILTGTTSGVALWMDGQPWLNPGDVVTCDFGPLGTIENVVEKDPIGTRIE
jgi:2-keto-4-pentenoate hydratase/2-oxohepta-3-ene-1,7-dioic acid hydratase in catechol pathway